jgi:hypothetical protein
MSEEVLQIYSQALAVLGGILFWAGFLIFGFIARRYSSVFNKPTFHTLLMTAPSGILAYSVLLILKGSLFVKDPDISGGIQAAAYIFLLVSAALCLAAILKFGSVLNELLKDRGQ